MLTILLFIDCFQMARIRINTKNHTKEKPYLINSYFFSKLVRHEKSIGWAKYMYVCEWDMCWRNFCNFPWWLKNVKSWSKIALFSNERHFEIWFQKKKKTITFFWSKLSKLHKKDPILHATTTFSLKQGETRTNSVPIPYPLRTCQTNRSVIEKCYCHCPVLIWQVLLKISYFKVFKYKIISRSNILILEKIPAGSASPLVTV